MADDDRRGLTYASAGVDVAAGEEAVRRIKASVRSTFRPEVIGDIGGFGGMFRFPKESYRDPVLVGTTDGVGTKAVIAQRLGQFSTIGVDLVAMCVDDLVCVGAEPLFFLNYIAVGRLDPAHIEQLVAGMASGCREAGCALVGGEMAEHPGSLEPGEFDLVGTAVGVVERNEIIDGSKVRRGDVVIGLLSPGLRSNGYSLARKALLEIGGRSLAEPAYPGTHVTLGEELLRPSVIYAPTMVALRRAVDLRAVAHITGGGFPSKLARVLPDDCDAVIDRSTWETPPIFDEIARVGDIDDDEMARTFNLGIGMAVVVDPGDVHRSLDVIREQGHRATIIGAIQGGTGRAVVTR